MRSEGLARPVMGPAYLVDWKAHPIENHPPEDHYGSLELHFVTSRMFTYAPHPTGGREHPTPPVKKGSYCPEGMVFPQGYDGFAVALRVLSPRQRRLNMGQQIVAHKHNLRGVPGSMLKVPGLQSSEAYLSQARVEIRTAVSRMSYQAALAKEDSVKPWLGYVLPRLGVIGEHDVETLKQMLLRVLLKLW